MSFLANEYVLLDRKKGLLEGFYCVHIEMDKLLKVHKNQITRIDITEYREKRR